MAVAALGVVAIILALKSGGSEPSLPAPPGPPDTREGAGGSLRRLTPADWERGIRVGKRYWAGECAPIKLYYAHIPGGGAWAYRDHCAVVLDPDEFERAPYVTFQGLAVHEVGHLAGCDHRGPRSIMYPVVNTRRARNVVIHFRERHRPHRCTVRPGG